MLARAAARSLRLYSSPGILQAASTHLQSRTYAKSKPKKPFEYKAPSESDVSNTQNFRTQQNDGKVSSAIADHQAKQSTATQPSSDVHFDKPIESSSHPEYSIEQDEFRTTAPSSDNTEPQFTSPSAINPAEAQKNSKQEPTRPLPDLTQGIPSTLDSELSSSSSRADPKSLNITEAPEEPGGQGGGDLPKSAYISSSERRRARIANYAFGGAFLSIILGVVYAGRNWADAEEESAHPDAPSGWGFGLFWNRVLARYHTKLDYYNEPAFPKLLPNVDPAFERPYTLVLSLEDLLVHSEWTRERGWQLAKRPGVDYFIRYLSNYYELVLFTSVPSMIGGPIFKKLDPYQVIMWPLFREATRYKKGKYIKDLSFLNRDLSKVILLDTDPSHAELQPENAIIIPKWKGDPNDKGLISLIPFLEFVGADTKDTREVLESFKGTDIAAEFARREAIHREKFLKEMDEKKAKRPRRSTGLLGNLLGAKPQGTLDGLETLSEGFEQGKTYNDMLRERGQKQYEMFDKQLRENGEEILKQMADDEKKMQDDALKDMKSSLSSVLPFGNNGGKSS
ncbi:mitochondrial inner membrane protein required for protein import [Lecanora helva]